MKLTKQAIAKLMDPVNHTVRVVNDAYREVTATAKFTKYKIEIRVAVVHPLLQEKVNVFRSERVTMIYWVERSGDKIEDIPEELAPVIEQMRQAATMSREEALQLCIGIHKYMADIDLSKVPQRIETKSETSVVEPKPEEVVPTNVVELNPSKDEAKPVPTEVNPDVEVKPEGVVIKPEGMVKKERKPSGRPSNNKVPPELRGCSIPQRNIIDKLKKGEFIPKTNYHTLVILQRKGLIADITQLPATMDMTTRKVHINFTASLV